MRFACTLFFLMLVLTSLVKADVSVPAFSWQEICAVSVCRGTGHDGVFAVEIAPDGEQLLVEVASTQQSGLFLVTQDQKTWRLTHGHSARWLPNNRQIVYLHEQNIWLFDITTNTAKQLTQGWSDIRSPEPSPDGKWLVFASNKSGHQDLWLMPVSGAKQPIQLTSKALPTDEQRFGFAWSPDSKRLAYFSNSAEYWSDDLWLVDIESKHQTQLTRDVMGQGQPSWSPDGTRIALYGTAKSDYWYTDLASIFVVDVDAKLTTELAMQVTAREMGAPQWSADGKQLFFPNQSRGDVDLWSVASGGGIATRITHQGGMLHDWDISWQSNQVALVRSTPIRGRDVDLLSTSGGELARVTHFATNWKNLTEPVEISYRSIDGMFIQGFMFRPPNFDPNRQYPAIVQVHGGGTHSYYNGLNLVEQYLAQKGYVVIAVNYRGGSGFERGFQDLGTNDWANTQALDAAAAADFIRAQSWSNGKVGIYGYSYGGITSLAAVARAPDAFDAAVPMAGIYDFAPAYENDNRVIRLFIKYGHSGTPQEQPAHYAVSNTIERLQAVKTPILLMHGEADSIASFDQFVMAQEALLKHGKVFATHSYPNEPHRFRSVENRVDMYQRLEAWMDRWLKSVD